MAARNVANEDDAKEDGLNSTGNWPRWPALACGAVAAIGVAWAAAFVTVQGVERDVGIAAWVAAAVVGASAVISAARTVQPPLRVLPREDKSKNGLNE